MTSSVLKMGVKGIILCLIALTPHFIFYIAGYLILLWYFFSYPESRWNLSKTVELPALYRRRDSAGVLCESGNYADVLEDVMREDWRRPIHSLSLSDNN